MTAVSLFAGVGGFDLAMQRNGIQVVATVTIARTLTARHDSSPDGDRGFNVVPDGSTVRRLTPVECERLQGFADGWTDGQTDGHRYRQMGNAVCVPVVEWIMERLVSADERAKGEA